MPSPKRKQAARAGRSGSPRKTARTRKTGRTSHAVKAKTPTAKRRRAPKVVAQAGGVTVSEIAELDQLRRELEQVSRRSPARWNADPEDVQRSVAQLVLTLVEFIRRLLERQAIRRMDAATLTPDQVEDIGRALMQLEETVLDMARRFGLSPDDLNLDLGPVGKLL